MWHLGTYLDIELLLNRRESFMYKLLSTILIYNNEKSWKKSIWLQGNGWITAHLAIKNGSNEEHWKCSWYTAKWKSRLYTDYGQR